MKCGYADVRRHFAYQLKGVESMNKLIVLRKYSLKKPSTGFIKPGPFEGIIKFEVDGRVTLKQGAYFTTNMFNTAGEAQKHLAITYSPKYECKFELNKDLDSSSKCNT
ncbi:MAG: hypothetical protein IIA61_10090 [Candidatus Marinimicrobia bacterium]|nr:hypothetical protein [Candidatus Neomarinimicrobiota bacterium]